LCLFLARHAAGQDMDLGALFGAMGGMGKGGGLGGKGGNAASICPAGKFVAPKLSSKLRPGELIANGCGPQGMQVDEPFGLWRCCNRHDVCFSACDVKFDYCEKQFKKCIKERCAHDDNKGKESECKSQGDGFTSMTAMFGAGSHASSMQAVCECKKTEAAANSQRRDYIVDIYKRFGNKTKADDAAYIDGLVSKYEGKQGKLYLELIHKYGGAEGFVEFDNIRNEFEIQGPSHGNGVLRKLGGGASHGEF